MPARPASMRRCRSARHDRHLFGGRQRQPHAAGAAAPSTARHQSDRGRGAGGQEPPVVLDIATTVVSYGTVKNYKLQDKPMPEGWMVDAKDGKPSPIRRTAPKACCCRSAATRARVSRWCSACSPARSTARRSAATWSTSTPTTRSVSNTGHFIIALDRRAFQPIDAFKAEVDRQAARPARVEDAARPERAAAGARRAPNAAPTASPTGCRWRRNCWWSWISWRRSFRSNCSATASKPGYCFAGTPPAAIVTQFQSSFGGWLAW